MASMISFKAHWSALLRHESTKALPGNPATDNPVLELTSENTIPGDFVNRANYESANEEKKQ